MGVRVSPAPLKIEVPVRIINLKIKKLSTILRYLEPSATTLSSALIKIKILSAK